MDEFVTTPGQLKDLMQDMEENLKDENLPEEAKANIRVSISNIKKMLKEYESRERKRKFFHAVKKTIVVGVSVSYRAVIGAAVIGLGMMGINYITKKD